MSDDVERRVYVSITGLKLKRLWHAPRFWSLAVPAMIQARRSPGNISAQARTIAGVHHTRSVWTNRDAVLAYVLSGAHREAMAVFDDIATGVTFGMEITPEAIPDWSQLHAEWRSRLSVAA